MLQTTRTLLDRFGVDIDPRARVGELAIGQQQQVAIVRTLSREPTLLILDEPTAVLTPQESRVLFEMMRTAASDGKSVLFVTHKIPEALAVAHSVSVLRAGACVATKSRSECIPAELARMMVGQDIQRVLRKSRVLGEPILVVRNLTATGSRGELALRDIDLVVHAGEIVAIAGVSGNGQQELAETLTGMQELHAGEIYIEGRLVKRLTPALFATAGGAYIPEDRRGTGMATDASVQDNAILRSYAHEDLRKGPWHVRRSARKFAETLVRDTRAIIPALTAPIHQLSGGNAQRLLVGREMAAARSLVVAMYPTQGLDIAASERVRTDIARAAEEGLGIVLISEDLDEMFILADTILVLYRGRIVGRGTPGTITSDQIGLLMAGLPHDTRGDAEA
jgi:simple sugar transport system ATP-binding protein